jgi:SAM-dependent methyltransferase
VGRILERAATLFFYAAAGAARLRDLQTAIQREWREAGASQSETFTSSGLMEWEKDFYLRFLRPADRILIVGCGPGRDLLALLQLGYRAEGLDVVPECTETARRILEKRGLVAPLYTGSIETISLPANFDVFIFSWFCYCYIPQSDTRIQVLRKVSRHLNAGGRILISYLPCAPLPRRLPIRLAKWVTRLTGSDWRPEYGDIVFMAPRGRHFIHYEHQFTAGTLAEEAKAAGLTVLFDERAAEGKAVLTP